MTILWRSYFKDMDKTEVDSEDLLVPAGSQSLVATIMSLGKSACGMRMRVSWVKTCPSFQH